MVLQRAPPSLFGSIVAILAYHLGQPIVLTNNMADLQKAEAIQAQKRMQFTIQRKFKRAL